jgi:hypothetical protein
MDKTYTQDESFFIFNEEFDESVIQEIPENITPEQSLVDAVLAYDKALSCMHTKTVGTTSLMLN